MSLPAPALRKYHGMRVASRSSEFVNQHHLRTEDSALGLQLVFAVTRGDARHELARQKLDNVGRQLAAAVETFVHDHRLLADLRKEVSSEVGLSAARRIGQVNVGHATAGHLVHFSPIVFDPRQVAQAVLVRNRNDRDLTRIGPGGIGSHFDRTCLFAVPSKY